MADRDRFPSGELVLELRDLAVAIELGNVGKFEATLNWVGRNPYAELCDVWNAGEKVDVVAKLRAAAARLERLAGASLTSEGKTGTVEAKAS